MGNRYVADTGYYYIHSGCKGLVSISVPLFSRPDSANITAVRLVSRKPLPVKQEPVHVPLLAVHGNVLYDFYYQSNIDTPYTERDIHQHTLQTNLSITVKNRYPLRLSFSTQQGNSSLFRNLTGARLYYNNRDFRNQLLMNAKNWGMGKLKQQLELDSLKQYEDSLRAKLMALRLDINMPDYKQRLIEAREQAMRFQLDSLAGRITAGQHGDSLYQRLMAEMNGRKLLLDSLQERLSATDKKYRQLDQKMGRQKAHLLDVLQHSRNSRELADELESMNLPDSIVPKGFKTLLAIRSFGIGRTMADYSELTAKNISITGVQLEYNPSWYLAVATGVVDYQFRNFIVREQRSPQYLSLVRAGWGMREGNHVFVTYYTGKKQLYGGALTDTGHLADNHLMGVALEGQWKLLPNTFLTAEVAKSSLPWNTRQFHGGSNASSMMDFSTHSNEAYTAAFSTLLPNWNTRINGMYKWMNSDFQSFSLYTTGSRQIAWNVQAEQPFFHQRLLLAAAIRKNDYATFYMPSNYQSNTVFKSLQLTMRIPRWPVASLGYQPSSQLVKLDESHFTEQVFSMLTATVTHTYKYHEILMSSMASYSRFYNRQTDSAFVYYNSRNWLGSHTLFLPQLTLTAQAAAAVTTDYALYTLSGEGTWKLRSWLDVGGTLKYNLQTVYDNRQWGYGINARIQVPYFGEMALRGDKSYMPGSSRQLVSNNTGRLTYTRIF
ncbi:hypothetical protein ACDQ55_14495 [Chitinophaga sp. 30R24]|uniref:hypothetical protein n=1 Tax=Chitinophaga sp. 30R24 TaxID=3248838 RepID=UPI003B8FAB8F